MPRMSSHAVAKAGLDHFVRHLAREEAHNGIRVNMVAPGTILTEELVTMLDKDPNTVKG